MFILAVLQLSLASIIHRKKIIPKIILWLCILISALQVSSLLFIGSYITPLALNNPGYINQIGFKPFLYFFNCILFSIFLSLFTSKSKFLKKTSVYVTLFCLLVLISLSRFSPVGGLHKTVRTIQNEKRLIEKLKVSAEAIKGSLMREKVVTDSVSYQYIKNKKYNVIVIFIEGMSYDVISEAVTPNINALIKKSINIRNYYNHTAATFRGLRGQLTSTYQWRGGIANGMGLAEISGEEIRKIYQHNQLFSLPDILKPNGYQTIFQASNSVTHPLSVMLSTLRFDRIVGLEDYPENRAWQINELSDASSFNLLLRETSSLKQPFFYGVYTVGTHIGLDSPDKKFGDKKNNYLNIFYNLDYYLGQYIDAFNKSRLSDNTILIITADHASYPSPDFKTTFKVTQKYFVDKIPFIIYKKGTKHADIDVQGKNSLALTPTILDVLGIHTARNMFLGDSIFEKHPVRKENYISAIGSDYYISSAGKVESLTDQKLIHRTQLLQGAGE